jgi:hypothetical protein
MTRNRSFILATILGSGLLAAGLSLAQAAGTPPVEQPAAVLRGGERVSAERIGRHAGRGARLAAAIRTDPALAVVLNLRAIERVYRATGRATELPAFYREQLARSKDPVLRNFISYRLARLEMRDDDAKAALDVLLRNLDDNYRRL